VQAVQLETAGYVRRYDAEHMLQVQDGTFELLRWRATGGSNAKAPELTEAQIEQVGLTSQTRATRRHSKVAHLRLLASVAAAAPASCDAPGMTG
jgi:hypothetical protein